MPEALEHAKKFWVDYIMPKCLEAKNPQIMTGMFENNDVLYRSLDFEDLAAYEAGSRRLSEDDEFKKKRAEGSEWFVEGTESVAVVRLR